MRNRITAAHIAEAKAALERQRQQLPAQLAELLASTLRKSRALQAKLANITVSRATVRLQFKDGTSCQFTVEAS